MLEFEPALRLPIEKLGLAGDLEKYLSGLATYGLDEFFFSELPSEMTLAGIESYANWLHRLTEVDPLYRERGALVWANNESGNLIYPRKPHVGTDNIVAPTLLNHSIDTCIGVVQIHTHPQDHTFSLYYPPSESGAIRGDLRAIFGSTIPAFMVTTSRNNYLLLKTSDTPLLSEEEFARKFDSSFGNDDFDAVLTRWVNETKYGYLHGDDQGKVLFDRANKDFHFPRSPKLDDDWQATNFAEYQTRLITIQRLCDILNCGFYYSDKDGIYRRLESESVIDFIEARWGAALDKAATELGIIPKQLPLF